MSRRLAFALLAVMLAVVIGQAVLLQRYSSRPVTQITLHDSRLVPFMQEIRAHNPATYDSLLLNLVRIRDARLQGQAVEDEEVLIAEQLIARLVGRPDADAAAARVAP